MLKDDSETGRQFRTELSKREFQVKPSGCGGQGWVRGRLWLRLGPKLAEEFSLTTPRQGTPPAPSRVSVSLDLSADLHTNTRTCYEPGSAYTCACAHTRHARHTRRTSYMRSSSTTGSTPRITEEERKSRGAPLRAPWLTPRLWIHVQIHEFKRHN